MTLPRAGNHPVVALIDDDSQTRLSFAMAFPELTVCGAWNEVEGFLRSRPPADLVILDLRLAPASRHLELQGPRAVAALVNVGYRVCVYTDGDRLLVLAQCFGAGAIGLVRKSDAIEGNRLAFELAASGQEVMPAGMAELANLLQRRRSYPELTQRQTEVLTARARGESFPSIAARLFITVPVARDHLAAAMRRVAIFLRQVELEPDASPADVERALGLAPGDLNEPMVS
jgi:DNA-binding NarL/FixJ family response regulator